MNSLKRFHVQIASAVAALILLCAICPVNAASGNSRAGFPLPVSSTYQVSTLSNYSGGGKHGSYLYTYGPMSNFGYDKYCLADIVAPANTPIYAVASGTIQTNRYGSGGGYYLVIKHDDGTYSYYGHMVKQSSCVVGSSVKAGDVIGYVGKTGNASGYHLHFEWSGHDPYCEFKSLGYISGTQLGASIYPHRHDGSDSSTNVNSATATTGVADSITQTSAILRGSVSSSGVKLTQCGVLLGTSKQNMTKLGSDSINTYGTTCFYSTSKYGRTLTPGTTYYYQIYAVDANGKEYKGDTRSFTTALCTNHVKGKYLWYAQVHPHYDHYICSVCGQQFRTTTTNNVSSCKICNPEPESCSHVKGKYLWFAAVHPHYNHYSCAKCGQTYREPETNFWHSCEICAPINAYGIRLSGLSTSGITANSVRLDASCAYTGSRPTSVGVYLGTSTSNMQIKGSDGNINHNKNPFSIWYNLSGLQPRTTYYYRFYAVVDGKVSFSEIKSFTTTK